MALDCHVELPMYTPIQACSFGWELGDLLRDFSVTLIPGLFDLVLKLK
jgi:hypothetical protein